MKALVLITIIICAIPTMASDVITGRVVDSVTGLPIPGVLVRITTPACSTQTDTGGNFKFTIYSTGTKRPAPQTSDIFAHLNKNASYELILLSGKTTPLIGGLFRINEMVHAKNISSGVFFVRERSENQTTVYKIMTVNSLSSQTEASPEKNSQTLAKTAASDYILNFQRTNYNSGSLTVSGSASNLVKKLAPLGTSANIDITLKPVDTLTVTTVINSPF